MMRILENGFKVKMIPTNGISYAVDTKNEEIITWLFLCIFSLKKKLSNKT